MTLTEAIQNYVGFKADFDTAEADYTNTQQVLVPQANDAVHSAEIQVSTDQAALRQATTTGDVQTARAAVEASKQALQDCIQLHDNLVAKMRSYELKRDQLMRDVKLAYIRMFELKRADLLSQFEIPVAQFDLLERILATGNGASSTWGTTLYSVPVDEKYGRMDFEQMKQLEQTLVSEMVASVS